MEGARYTGTVVTVSGRNTFLKCDEIKKIYPKDVFCPSEALGGCAIGDLVDFELMVKNGQPQARNAQLRCQQTWLSQAPVCVPPKGRVVPPPRREIVEAMHADEVRSPIMSSVANDNCNSMPSQGILTGVIQRLADKFGFIACPDLGDVYGGKDVWCPSSLLGGLNVGDSVEFELLTNVKGQPQASNLRRVGASTTTVTSNADKMVAVVGATSTISEQTEGNSTIVEQYDGTVKSIDGEHGLIESPEVTCTVGADVYCEAALLQGFRAGDPVSFDLWFDESGSPQATAIRPRDGVADGEEMKSEKYIGVISFMRERNCFISCENVTAAYGKDAFCPTNMVQGLCVGDHVEFELMVNQKGQPQAHNVRTCTNGSVGQVDSRASHGISAGQVTEAQLHHQADGQCTACTGKVVLLQPPNAFIACDSSVAAHPGKDVFCPAALLVGLDVNDLVCFDLVFNSKGQPQARNIRAPSARVTNGSYAQRHSQIQSQGGNHYTGVITALKPQYGFIACEEIQTTYGKDVFCPAEAILGLSVGDRVDFDLIFNQKGQPQAANARASSTRYGQQALPATVNGVGDTCVGVIKAFSDKSAFIECREVFDACGRDVFCPAVALSGMSIGDAVEFELLVNPKGQPQAGNVRASLVLSAASANSGAGQQKRIAPMPTGETLTGTVTSKSEVYGFISCEEVTQQYGRDVFCPSPAIGELMIGDTVMFELVINQKGQPQASNVRRPEEDKTWLGTENKRPRYFA